MKNENKSQTLLLVINDFLSARIFIETGILSELESKLPNKLLILINEDNLDIDEIQSKCKRAKFIPISLFSNVKGLRFKDRLFAYIDYRMDEKFGFFPLSLRFNIQNNFQEGRRTWGNKNAFLDLNRVGPLPQWKILYKLMFKWYFSTRLRFVHPRFKQMCAEENVTGILVSNVQHPQNAPFLIAARRLGIPVISYIASWDHPVGKGPVFPFAQRYIAQNEIVRQTLVRYHNIQSSKICVTGWPQMDYYGKSGNADEFKKLLQKYGLRVDRPCVLLAGCTENNAPFEPNQMEKIVNWRDENGGGDKFSIIFRPHPRDFNWAERYRSLLDRESVYIQKQTFSHMDELALVLKNVSCAVCTAGTILIDSIANDRPVVALAYDEDDSRGGDHTMKNYWNEHYKEIMEHKPFYLAKSLYDVITGVQQAIANPDELSVARANVKQLLVGTIDGKAAYRVVDCVVKEYSRIENIS